MSKAKPAPRICKYPATLSCRLSFLKGLFVLLVDIKVVAYVLQFDQQHLYMTQCTIDLKFWKGLLLNVLTNVFNIFHVNN